MKKEIYIIPSIEILLLETEGVFLAGSRFNLEIDPIPDNGGVDYLESE